MLDLGNAFYKDPFTAQDNKEAATAFADLICRANKEMGLGIQVPGQQDFALGLESAQNLYTTSGATVLGGNLIDEKTGTPLFKEFTVVERKGRKIGFFGIVTSEWKWFRRDLEHPGIKIENPVEYAKRVFPKVKAQADIVIAVTSLKDDEMKAVAEALPELKFVLRSNAKGVFANKNQEMGNAIIMSVPGRGRTLGILRLVIRDNNMNFVDMSQKKDLENQIENYTYKIEEMMEKSKVKSIDALKEKLKEAKYKLRRVERYQDKLARAKEELKKVKEADTSFMEVNRVALDMRVAGDPAIEKMVKDVVAKWGEPKKLRPKSPLHGSMGKKLGGFKKTSLGLKQNMVAPTNELEPKKK